MVSDNQKEGSKGTLCQKGFGLENNFGIRKIDRVSLLWIWLTGLGPSESKLIKVTIHFIILYICGYFLSI